MSLNDIGENKILAKISESTVSVQIHIGSTLITLNIWPFKAPHSSLSLNPVTPEQCLRGARKMQNAEVHTVRPKLSP